MSTPRPRWRWYLYSASFALWHRFHWRWAYRLASRALSSVMTGDGGAKCGEGEPF